MHFFIDHTQLPAQTTSDMKFGPVNNQLFNISTQFRLTSEAKAFACQNGMMIVQKNNDDPDNLVNVVIKPLKSVTVNGIPVKYYIYRGLTYNSFFTSAGAIIPQSNTKKSEFITAFWDSRAKPENKPQNETPTPFNIGYSNFDKSTPLSIIFAGKMDAKAINVSEGMWIGNFANTRAVAFDIELESGLRISTTVAACRDSEIKISISNGSEIEKKKKKESILSFIDPAAFFGAYAKTGVGTRTSTSTKPTIQKLKDLYNNVLVKFSNKNRVYLDIRSENGLSYNFYNTYKISSSDISNIWLYGLAASEYVSKNPPTTSEKVNYGTQGWPIMYFEKSDNIRNNTNKLIFRLCLNDNTNPVLFFENSTFNSLKDKPNPLKGNEIKDTNAGSQDWTLFIELIYANIGGTSINNIANYIRLYYFMGDPVLSVNPRLCNKKYFDSAFCSIDISNIDSDSIIENYVNSSIPKYIKEPLRTDGSGAFSYIGKSGAYWDIYRILFYTKNILKREKDGSGKKYLKTFSQKLSLKNTKFQEDLNQNIDVIYKKYKLSSSSSENKIVGLNNYVQNNVPKEKEDLLLLGLSLLEIIRLQNVQGLSSVHPKFIFLDPDFTSHHLTDESSSHSRYFRYKAKVQGVNASGIPAIVEPDIPVIVYSRDNVFFNSLDFARLEPDNADNRLNSSNIEFHIFHDDPIRINDNIDLALVRKSVLADEHTVMPDNSVPNDNSLVQKIYYYYHEINHITPELICSFDIVMANKMSNGKKLPSIPAGYNLAITYSKGSAKRTLSDNGGNLITSTASSGNGGTNREYNNQKKKVFLVHFVTTATANDSYKNIIFNNANNNLGIIMNYSGTLRRFTSPAFAALVLRVLIRTKFNIVCTGLTFGDASCYPSSNHVNGYAIDTSYLDLPPSTCQQDVDFINAFYYFGIKLMMVGVGKDILVENLQDEPSFINHVVKIDTKPKSDKTKETVHDSHLHSDSL